MNDSRSGSLGEQALPHEIIALILDNLVANEQFRTLATIARCNMPIYDLVIPKLYNTIRISRNNRNGLFVGSTGTSICRMHKLISSYS
jgi:hypothetical protein